MKQASKLLIAESSWLIAESRRLIASPHIISTTFFVKYQSIILR